MNDPLTVSELTRRIKINLESAFPIVTLQGEVSNFKQQSSGHLYFSLKDQHAQISAVMFKKDADALPKMPKDGDQVIATGEINVYPAGGRYQIVIKQLKLAGLGDLLLKLEELKGKLHKLGWFSQKHKKPLPKFPKTIGVVTSPTGAVIQDILNILSRRYSGFHLILYPVKVQGDGAAAEIAQAIDEMNRYQVADVLIVGRGGGSIEDLWAFNEEIVAAAIFRSGIPIISAVGHETDHCIADYVADVRAPTPSAAAEMVIAEKEQLLKFLDHTQKRMAQTLQHLVRHGQTRLNGIKRLPLFLNPYTLLGPWFQKIDGMSMECDQILKRKFLGLRQLITGKQKHLSSLKPTLQLTHFRQKLNDKQRGIELALQNRLINKRRELQERQTILDRAIGVKLAACRQSFSLTAKRRELERIWQQTLNLKKERCASLIRQLKSIDPKHLLKKGYSILFSEKKNSVISSVYDVKDESGIVALLADGKIITKITEIQPNG